MGPWMSYSISLGLSSLICKMRSVMVKLRCVNLSRLQFPDIRSNTNLDGSAKSFLDEINIYISRF